MAQEVAYDGHWTLESGKMAYGMVRGSKGARKACNRNPETIVKCRRRVDCNKTPRHRRLFSSFISDLPCFPHVHGSGNRVTPCFEYLTANQTLPQGKIDADQFHARCTSRSGTFLLRLLKTNHLLSGYQRFLDVVQSLCKYCTSSLTFQRLPSSNRGGK